MHKIIMISGKQGSGKSTLADSLEKVAQDRGYNVVRTRFAKILYEMHDAALAVAKKYGIPVSQKEGDMLQWIGTEWGRHLKGESVWADALRHSINEQIKSNDDLEKSRYQPGGSVSDFMVLPLCFIIDDLRFQNEFDAFQTNKDQQVYKVRLEASRDVRKARCSYWRENDSHPSETGLDHLVTLRLGSVTAFGDVREAARRAEAGSGFDLQVNAEVNNAETILKIVADKVFK